jgi:hypothetical protein
MSQFQIRLGTLGTILIWSQNTCAPLFIFIFKGSKNPPCAWLNSDGYLVDHVFRTLQKTDTNTQDITLKTSGIPTKTSGVLESFQMTPRCCVMSCCVASLVLDEGKCINMLSIGVKCSHKAISKLFFDCYNPQVIREASSFVATCYLFSIYNYIHRANLQKWQEVYRWQVPWKTKFVSKFKITVKFQKITSDFLNSM